MANMDYTAMLRNLDLYRPKQPYQGLQSQPQPGAPQPYSGFGMGHHPMGGGYMQNLQQIIRQKDQPWHNGSMQAPVAPVAAPGAIPPAAPMQMNPGGQMKSPMNPQGHMKGWAR